MGSKEFSWVVRRFCSLGSKEAPRVVKRFGSMGNKEVTNICVVLKDPIIMTYWLSHMKIYLIGGTSYLDKPKFFKHGVN